MKGNYPDDTFTENDVLSCLEGAGLKYKQGSRYILSQCPTHEDAHPSVQIYKDDWFVNCHAGCGRFHITKAFPGLRPTQHDGRTVYARPTKKESPVIEHKYKTFDLTANWLQMQCLMEGEVDVHGLPAEVLNDLGWRWASLNHDKIFIPYFSASKGSIPFAQYRNLGSGPRFNFWKDAKPTMYGTWNLDNQKLFLVEGTSDAAVLEYAAVPWIAAPSAASGELVKLLAGYCKQNGITIVFAGDNDSAGSKLREALDEVTTYRVKQPPTKYKDWGEFFEAEGVEAIQAYCFPELGLQASITPDVTAEFKQEYPSTPEEVRTSLENVKSVFPGASKFEVVTDPPQSKELSGGSAPALF